MSGLLFEDSFPIHFLCGFMQAMIIFHDVIGKLCKEFLCDLAHGFERHDRIQSPVDDDGWNRNSFDVQI